MMAPLPDLLLQVVRTTPLTKVAPAHIIMKAAMVIEVATEALEAAEQMVELAATELPAKVITVIILVMVI
jgi:ABC-type spermidine/putrescine transport system permease subunit II